MRNASLVDLDHLGVPVLPIATAYPADHVLEWHAHRRAQLLFAATGTMLVDTDDGAWTVPGERAVLIPPQTRHRVRMLDVQTSSLYVEPSAAPWWPATCMVVEIGALLRALLLAAGDVDVRRPLSDRDETLLALVLHEVATLREAPLHVPLPQDPSMASLCRDYLAQPDLRIDNAAWARAAMVSERTLTRRFRAQTGIGPGAWRTRARLLSAIPMLRHRGVTEVAGVLGYASPAAFSSAFRTALGFSPSTLRR